MKKIVSIILAAALALSVFAGCSGKSDKDKGKLKILTTIAPQYDWLNNLTDGAKDVELNMLLDTGADLHSFQPSTDDIYQISSCDVFVYTGGNSDKWVDNALKNNEKVLAINLMELFGDKAKEDARFTPTPGGHAHTTDLIRQVQRFNDGYFADGTPIKNPGRRFDFGVACYPEKHEEAPNLERDMQYLKEKQDLGAQYAVTQLFFDNQKYFEFVEKARAMGITIPIIPGIKPMAKLSQLTVVPKTFHCDIPEPLAREIVKCKTDEDARQLGIEWTTEQCRELYAHGVDNIHFYTVSAVDSVVEVTRRLL